MHLLYLNYEMQYIRTNVLDITVKISSYLKVLTLVSTAL